MRAVIAQGLDATIVNPTGIIGPVDFGPSRINSIIDQAARGHLPVVVAGGFDWVDVRDVVAGLVSASTCGRTVTVFGGTGFLGRRITSKKIDLRS